MSVDILHTDTCKVIWLCLILQQEWSYCHCRESTISSFSRSFSVLLLLMEWRNHSIWLWKRSRCECNNHFHWSNTIASHQLCCKDRDQFYNHHHRQTVSAARFVLTVFSLYLLYLYILRLSLLISFCLLSVVLSWWCTRILLTSKWPQLNFSAHRCSRVSIMSKVELILLVFALRKNWWNYCSTTSQAIILL